MVNAKVWELTGNNQFETKRKETKENYILYAPFPEPKAREDHLRDMLLYAKRFYADRASLLLVDLGLDKELKPILQKRINGFEILLVAGGTQQ